MRSVVVVLPASMWAMMPMFRVRSSSGFMCCLGSLPAIVGERLVGLRHAMHVFSSFYGCSLPPRCIEQLARKLLRHALARPSSGGGDEPAHGEGDAPVA